MIDGVSAIIDTVQGESANWEDPDHSPREPYLIPMAVVGFLILIVFMAVLIKDNFFSRAAAGGVFVPFGAMFIYDTSMMQIFALAAAGFAAGLIFSLVRRWIESKRGRYAAYRIEPGDHDDPSAGGTGISIGGGSGSSSGGGASGGGGSFGGGGASGRW